VSLVQLEHWNQFVLALPQLVAQLVARLLRFRPGLAAAAQMMAGTPRYRNFDCNHCYSCRHHYFATTLTGFPYLQD